MRKKDKIEEVKVKGQLSIIIEIKVTEDTKSKKILKKRKNQVFEDIEETIEAHCGFVGQNMDFIYKSKFWTKCPYCEMEFQYSTFFKNGNRSYPICSKYFIMKDDQSNS